MDITKRNFILVILFFIFLCASAQIQQGRVKTRGRLNADGTVKTGQGIIGATVTLSNGTQVSGNNGNFSFSTTNGTFVLKNVQKKDYQLCDRDVLGRNKKYSANPFIIVMDSPENQLADQLVSEKKIRRTLQRQLQKREDELESLKERLLITEEEYRSQLQQLYADAENNESLISTMAKRYASLDFDQMDDFQRQVAFYIQNGELARADSLLRTKGTMEERSAELDRIHAANVKGRTELEQSEAYEETMLADFVQDCYNHYEICKMQHKKDSAMYYITLPLSKDSVNIDYLYQAASSAEELGLSNIAEKFYTRILGMLKSNPTSFVAHCYTEMEENFGITGDNLSEEECLVLSELSLNLDLSRCSSDGYYYLVEAKRLVESIDGSDFINIEKVWFPCRFAVWERLLHFYIDNDNYKESKLFLNELEGICKGDTLLYNRLLYNSIGFYRHFGQYENAVECIEQSDWLYNRENNAPYHLFQFYYESARLYYEFGKYDKAIEYYTKALDIVEISHWEESINYGQVLNGIGQVYVEWGDYEHALDYFQKSLDQCEYLYGECNESSVNIMQNIALVHRYLGNYDTSKKMYIKSLNTAFRFKGDVSSMAAIILHNIGEFYEHIEQNDSAQTYYEKALYCFSNSVGMNHPYTIECYKKIARVCIAKNEYHKASEFINTVLETNESQRTRKTFNIELGNLCENVGLYYFQSEEYSKALFYINNALKLYIENLGLKHTMVAKTYVGLGILYKKLEDYMQALECYQKAMNIFRDNLENETQNIATVWNMLYELYDEAASRGLTLPGYSDFMNETVFNLITVEGETPAKQQGLDGEYIVLEFGDWNISVIESLFRKNEELRGRPKNIVVMKNGVISQHYFENSIGAKLGYKYVGEEEKQRIIREYQNWKNNK